MIRINPNSAGQSVYVSPWQARKFLDAITYYLLELEDVQSGEKFYVIPTVDVDNARYSTFTFNTNADAGATGSVLITGSGQYLFSIYGQTSSSNLNPLDVSVMGKMQVGACEVVGVNIANFPDINIPNNVIYYE